ncbi:phosphopantetheine-binding protein [Amycolatopsis sp. NPDC049868]|uniref:phosphopantetheine-binding protein n=1 Tax=Amycolatopsis sp. NPDC049868 TaxID=3363934 RepID=UPI0037B8922B
MHDQAIDLVPAIGRVMGEVLTREPLDGEDDFFACGGDSVRAVEVLQRLASEHGPAGEEASDIFQAQLLLAIFDDASPAALASVITSYVD